MRAFQFSRLRKLDRSVCPWRSHPNGPTTDSGGGYVLVWDVFLADFGEDCGPCALHVTGMSNTSLVSLLENTADQMGGYTCPFGELAWLNCGRAGRLMIAGWNRYFEYGQVDA
jgi:hypothetical protein